VGVDVGVSVVVPAYRAARYLPRCLAALERSQVRPLEVIVVDDGSPDGTADVARSRGARVLRLPHRGAAAARNAGARAARGDLLLFLDADVAVAGDTIGRAIESLGGHGAVIGVYSAEGPQGVVTRFRNLLHRHTMLGGPRLCRQFFTACGLVRRDLFLELGGMDESLAFLEDVEFGRRLTEAGHTIFLDRGLEFVHLKEYTLWSMMRQDLLGRAVPWVRLVLSRRRLEGEFATGGKERWSVVLAAASIAAAVAAALRPAAAAVAGLAMLLLLGLHASFHRYLYHQGGVRLALAGFGLRFLFYLVCLVGIVLGCAAHLRDGRRRARAGGVGA